MALTDKRQQVKDDLEKMKLEGLEAMTRKQVDDMEKNLNLAEQKHLKAVATSEKSKKTCLDLQAGIEHLSGRLNEIKISSENDKNLQNINTVTNYNMVECLEQSRQKLKILIREMKKDPDMFAEAMSHVQSGFKHNNNQSLKSQKQVSSNSNVAQS